jgi:hypothetical protein
LGRVNAAVVAQKLGRRDNVEMGGQFRFRTPAIGVAKNHAQLSLDDTGRVFSIPEHPHPAMFSRAECIPAVVCESRRAMKLNLILPRSSWPELESAVEALLPCLASLGVLVSAFGRASGNPDSALHRALSNAESYDPAAPSLALGRPRDMILFPGWGKRCGLLLDDQGLDPEELRHLARLKLLLVPSQWALQRLLQSDLARSGTTSGPQIAVVPMGVSDDIFRPLEPPYSLPEYTFLGLGSQGQDLLLASFSLAFGPTDPVRLWLPWDGAPESAQVVAMSRPTSDLELAELMSVVDCGVLAGPPASWSPELLQMMACQRKVIAPKVGGHREFASEPSCALFAPGDQDDLAQRLREAVAKGRSPNTESGDVVSAFSWINWARQALAFLVQP